MTTNRKAMRNVDIDALPYRACVGVALFSRDGRVFVGRRKSEAGPEHVGGGYAWQMPQGGIDHGEDPYNAALRELHEETNVRTVRFLGEVEDWLNYDLPRDVAGRAWKGRYRGQSQKWFAFRFLGEENEIDIRCPAGHRPEFDEWRWERLENLPDLIIPFKRGVYERVVSEFAPFAGES